MEQKIEEEMAKVEQAGGIIKAVTSGYAQRMVSRQAYAFEKGIQTGELLKVGVNIYTEGEDMDVELHEYNTESAERQVQNLRALKKERNDREVARTLSELEQAAKSGKNVMPYLVDCCRAYATVGEMTQVFRDVYGEFQEPSIF
jgi:methylmalonyl-CoA mutase N-terminal domain/subunit